MYKPFMTLSKRIYTLFMSIALIAFAGSLSAKGKDDFLQQVSVGADINDVDGINKTAIYKGNVEVRQGSLSIDADELEVVVGENEGDQVFIARGNPAEYSQLDEEGNRVTASANEIKYEQSTRIIVLTGNAKLSRDGQVIESELITIDIESEALKAGAEGDRVNTIYQPKPKNEDEEKEQEKEEQP
ncbi:lipopolysaccharide transport periplasmic protein LptA [Alteromonadaceae bacterium M269]|nr:lipopolysaccharide transport periplasmic protein LptA [Alteromonadaceae bacterium M269]